MAIQRVEAIPSSVRTGGGSGRPAQVHPDGEELLAAGPGSYLVETIEHDGSEEGVKAAKNKAQSVVRQLKNVDVSVKTRSVSFEDAIQVFAVVMTEDEQAEHFEKLEARSAKRAATIAAGETPEADEDEEDVQG